MTIKRIVVLVSLIAAALPVDACRVLAKYPKHLSGTSPNWATSYRLGTIVEATKTGYLVRIDREFGASALTGKTVSVDFARGEEAHAVCPNLFDVGETYLIYSKSSAAPLEISRYDWMNVSKAHLNFKGYLQDLATASTKGRAQ